MQDANAVKNITLFHSYFQTPFSENLMFNAPVLLDRDKHDLIGVEITSVQNISWLYVDFGYLVNGT
jgi:hypothetical protein